MILSEREAQPPRDWALLINGGSAQGRQSALSIWTLEPTAGGKPAKSTVLPFEDLSSARNNGYFSRSRPFDVVVWIGSGLSLLVSGDRPNDEQGYGCTLAQFAQRDRPPCRSPA
jgi:hypothetical protein